MKKAIICDIDGTLAIRCDRSPYDASKAKNDTVNKPVGLLLDMISNSKMEIIFVSGRSEKDREVTASWLTSHGFEWNYLFMRSDEDNRQDAVVKTEIYNEHIKGNWDIIFVIDDRDQTVKGWRELGLPCFQVAEGDF